VAPRGRPPASVRFGIGGFLGRRLGEVGGPLPRGDRRGGPASRRPPNVPGPGVGRSVNLRFMALYDIAIASLDGSPSSLAPYQGKALLLVNVASKCGLTPQYEGLEKLQQRYADKGFSVLGFPCNQFAGQEPGSAEEIAEFCSTNYGVSFPLFEKIDVNGAGRHPIYAELTQKADEDGGAGDIQWNFEKFLVSPSGEIVGRFRPRVDPEDPTLVGAIEANLPS